MIRSFQQLLYAAIEISKSKALVGFKGKVSMKVTKDEHSLVAAEIFDGTMPLRLCDIPLRMINE